MPSKLRLARESDAPAILAIYAPIVEHSAISFEYAPPTEDEIRERMRTVLEFAPWIVWEEDGVALGYAYGSRFRARTAYQWSVEVTVYVHASHHGRGLGRKLYSALFELLRAQGFHLAIGGITLPNAASVALHESFGFRPVGVFEEVGHKQAAWHGVGFWQLVIGPGSAPRAPRAPRECASHSTWIAILGDAR